VLTLAAYAAKVDANGVPVRDAKGRFLRGSLAAVNLMQKGKGWGEDIPATIRNGDWVYQSFTPAGVPNDKANLTACYQCHLPFAQHDYLTKLVKIGPADVVVAGFSFGPTAIKGSAGQFVTWTNNADTPHQIALTGGNSQRSDVMLKGQSATLKFDAAGNIAYIRGLHLHPTIKGTIEVAAKN